MIARRNFLALGAVAALPACGLMPSSGPTSGEITGSTPDYTVISLDRARVARVAEAEAPLEQATALLPGRALGRIGPGDVIKVTVWEANPTGSTLLSQPGLDLPIRVGLDGAITLPHAGRISVSGRTPAQVEALLVGRLSRQGQGIQASVAVTEDNTNAVIVQGEVNRPGRYPLTPGAMGALDVLALAGGARVAQGQAFLRVTRNETSVTRPLSRMVREGDNIRLAPGDRVSVLPRDQHFFAFGAVSRPGEQSYDAEELSLTRTLARLSGLIDSRADPAGVFVFRRQAPEVTRRLLDGAEATGDLSQVIYRVNMGGGDGFFVADAFRVRPGDVVYVSNAPISEAAKVIQLFTGFTSLAGASRAVAAMP